VQRHSNPPWIFLCGVFLRDPCAERGLIRRTLFRIKRQFGSAFDLLCDDGLSKRVEVRISLAKKIRDARVLGHVDGTHVSLLIVGLEGFQPLLADPLYPLLLLLLGGRMQALHCLTKTAHAVLRSGHHRTPMITDDVQLLDMLVLRSPFLLCTLLPLQLFRLAGIADSGQTPHVPEVGAIQGKKQTMHELLHH
jgi:hypothetical protein